ncbi:transposase [Nocardia brasiliensis]|uniref:transposase n=1 Tax=Nocardia brasiliensis TaxID=37326 RepID=UPI00130E20C9|nr:transposase [Nocardia brasiliensis]
MVASERISDSGEGLSILLRLLVEHDPTVGIRTRRTTRLDSAPCRTILSTAPTTESARLLTARRLSSLLKKAGRQRGITEEATRLHTALRQEALRQPAAVQRAMGLQLQGLLRQLDAICDTVAELVEAAENAFHAHRTPESRAASRVSGPSSAPVFLAEIGDDRARFADARELRAFAGAAPVTRASGKSSFVHACRAKEQSPRDNWLCLGVGRRPP